MLALSGCWAPKPPDDWLGAEVKVEGGRFTPIAEGSTVPRGSQLRFALGAARDGHVAIAAVDAKGSVVPYYPFAGGTAPIHGGPPARVPSGISVTAPPGPLRLVALFCDEQPPIEPFWAVLSEHLAAAGGDPANMTPLGLESCRDRSLLLTVR